MNRTSTKRGKAETTFPSDRNRRGLSDHCAQVARHDGRIQVAALANNVHPDRMIVLLRVLLENVFQPKQCMDLGGLTHGYLLIWTSAGLAGWHGYLRLAWQTAG